MDVTIDDLRAAGYGDQFDAIDAAVGAHEAGDGPNVALVADPFAGRDLLADYAAGRLDPTTTVSLDGVDGDRKLPDVAGHGAGETVVVEDCHYLFSRRIGGFDDLEAFLERVALSDPTIVTTWNAHAWDYLEAVRDVDRSFDATVRTPAVDAIDLATLLDAHHDGPRPDFVETDAGGRVKTVSFDRRSISFPGGRALTVPTPVVNPEYLLSRRSDDVVGDVQAVVYQKLVQVAGGNPGVAATLWDESVRDGEIAPSYVPEYDPSVSFDDDTAFVLELVVSNERIRRDALDAVTSGVAVDRALETLSNRGIVTVDGEWAELTPQYWRATVDHLQGRQLLW